MDYYQPLYELFQQHSNPTLAQQMAKYMAFQFDFYGIQKPLRASLQKRFWQQYQLPTPEQLQEHLYELWQHPKREPQYTAIDLLDKFKNNLPQNCIHTLEYLITHKSWWDSVDLLATKFVLAYFQQYPDAEEEYFYKWLKSDNIWLQRTTLIYQLRRKQNTNLKLLTTAIEHLKDSDQFFIQKAIGWALREYSKFDPKFVRQYVKNNQLPKLSRREALRYLNRKKIAD